MKSRQLLAIALLSFLGGSIAMATPRHTVKRGTVLLIETQFVANVKVQAASLTWQAFQLVDPHTHEVYDDVSPAQRGMARAFRCDANVVASQSGVAFSCKVPLDVADGIYYLISISIQTSDSERKYSWLHDLPADVEVQIEGGDALIVPHIKAIQVKQL